VLCSLLWVTLLGQGVGLGDPQRSLPTPTILWFCDSVGAAGAPWGSLGQAPAPTLHWMLTITHVKGRRKKIML